MQAIKTKLTSQKSKNNSYLLLIKQKRHGTILYQPLKSHKILKKRMLNKMSINKYSILIKTNSIF